MKHTQTPACLTAFFTLALLLFSCTKERSASSFQYATQLEKAVTIPFDSLVENFRYVQLETTEKSLLGEVEQLVYDDEHIYILTDGLYCFDREGKFRYAINQKGNAPNEYIRLANFSVANGRLYLYDSMTANLMEFDSTNGAFIRRERVPDFALNAYVVGNSLILYNGGLVSEVTPNGERFLVYNLDDRTQIQRAYFPLEQNIAAIFSQLTYQTDGIHFADSYRCRSYKLTADTLHTYYQLVLTADQALSEGEIDAIASQNRVMDKSLPDDKIYLMLHMQENNRFILSSVYYPKGVVQQGFVIYDKIGDRNLFLDNVETQGLQLWPLEVVGAYGDTFATVCIPFLASLTRGDEGFVANLTEGDTHYHEQQVIMNSQKEDNPIIAFYKFRAME